MSQGAGQWYVRMQGRVLGPFNPSQLASLRDRGRLTLEHEISQDRRSWIKAAEMQSVFARAAQPQPQPHPAPARAVELEWPVSSAAEEPAPAQFSAAAPAETSLAWFVARGDSHQGPMSHADVQRMINTGELGTSSLVWKQGMANWQPAAQVPDFRFGAAAAAAAGGAAGAAIPSSANANQYAHMAPTSGMAIASLVLGLLWLCGIGSLLATIFGGMALSRISRSNGAILGKGLAFAGLILGILGLTSSVGVAIVFMLFRLSGQEVR
jgi:hypothetical protein